MKVPAFPRSQKGRSLKWEGFTLTELLVVVAIMAALMTLAVPALRSVLTANSIAAGGQLVADQLTLARQEAITKNGDVEVRFYKLAAPGSGISGDTISALQTFSVRQDGSRFPLGALVRMPTGSVISNDKALSGILEQTSFQTPASTDPELPGAGKAYAWISVLFHADGSTGLPKDDTKANNFLTIVNSRDSGPAPLNYYSIAIEALNGRIKTYRP